MQHRLVVQHQLPVLHRVAQLGGDGGLVLDGGAQVGGEQPDPVAAGRLGRVHRQVGVTDQVGGAHPRGRGLRGRGDPDADAQPHHPPAQVEGPVDAGPAAVGEGLRAGGVAVAAQHDELVPAEPADGVAGPGGAGQPRGDLPQQVVAGVVAEGVVDVLEAVDVEEEHRHRAAVVLLELGVDELVQVGAVGQLGEGVVAGPPVRGALGGDPGGDVGVGDHHLPGLVDTGGLQVDPVRAVRQLEGVVGLHRRALAAGERAQLVDEGGGAVVAVEPAGHREVVAVHPDPDPVVAEDVGGLVPRGVGQQHGAVGVDQQGGRGQRVEHRLHDDGGPVRPVDPPADVDRQVGLVLSSSHVPSSPAPAALVDLGGYGAHGGSAHGRVPPSRLPGSRVSRTTQSR